jgi:arylsulfatase A
MEPPFPTLQYFENLLGHRAGKRVFGPDYYSNYLIDFIKRHASGPFFAYYPMVLPHLPGVATPDSDARTTTAAHPAGILETILHDLEAMRTTDSDDQTLFIGMVAYMDKLVGRIIRTLDDLKIREKTMIIFTGDNGTAAQITSRIGNAEIVGGKGQMNDAGSHVPLIVNWPGPGGSGSICDDLVDFSDVFPTLVEVAGAKLPAGYIVDGRSMLDQIRGLGGKPRDWILIELDDKAAVLGRHWKLLNDGELFDVTNDPREKFPVTAMHDTAESAQARKELDSVLASFGLKSA